MKTNMAQLSNKRKKKENTLLSIELNVKNLITLIFLASLTGMTIFYLGMLFGKATRDPNLGLVEDAPDRKTATTSQTKAEIPKDLKIFDIRDQENNLSDLKKDFDALSQKSDTLIKKTKKENAEQKRLVQEARKIIAAPQPAPIKVPQKQWPDKPSQQAELGSGSIYTLQVLATISQSKSNLITKQLLQKGFDAYVISDRIDGKDIYKVRVGRKGKGSIQKLKPRLDRVVAGMGVKTKILKIK